MDFVYRKINGFTFKVTESLSAASNNLLIGDSLVREFTMQECDVISIAGGRAEDVRSYLTQINLDKYHYVILFCGRNSFTSNVKNGTVRQQMSPNDVKQDIDLTAEFLHELGIRVFVIGIPKRNFTFTDICLFNQLLCEEPNRYLYVAVSTNMSTVNVLRPDGVHLNQHGLTQLKSVINKVIRYLFNE